MTLGFVITVWDSAIYETADAQECPVGLQFGEMDQWLALSDAQRLEQNRQFGFRWNRGPNGENGITAPGPIKDSLPFREVQSEFAYGLNLDGTQDGHATSNSCAHDKFSSVSGTENVDHQLYRATGCAQGMRKGGFQREWVAREIQTQPSNRNLIVITGVDDEQNDSEVTLSVYKGYDGLVEEPVGSFLPNTTQHVDERFPQPLFSTHASIVDGVVTTDVVAIARFQINWINAVGWRVLRGMRLRLKLTENCAEGLIGGYEDIEEYWDSWRRGSSGSQDISAWSGASIYHAIKRFADGFPDPDTGECTSISTAYRIEAADANIIPADVQKGYVWSGDIADHPARNELFGF